MFWNVVDDVQADLLASGGDVEEVLSGVKRAEVGELWGCVGGILGVRLEGRVEVWGDVVAGLFPALWCTTDLWSEWSGRGDKKEEEEELTSRTAQSLSASSWLILPRGKPQEELDLHPLTRRTLFLLGLSRMAPRTGTLVLYLRKSLYALMGSYVKTAKGAQAAKRSSPNWGRLGPGRSLLTGRTKS